MTVETSGTPQTVEALHGHLTALSEAHSDAVSFGVEEGITTVHLGGQTEGWLVGRASDGWVVFDPSYDRAEMAEFMNALTVATTIAAAPAVDASAAETVNDRARRTGEALTVAVQ